MDIMCTRISASLSAIVWVRDSVQLMELVYNVLSAVICVMQLYNAQCAWLIILWLEQSARRHAKSRKTARL